MVAMGQERPSTNSKLTLNCIRYWGEVTMDLMPESARLISKHEPFEQHIHLRRNDANVHPFGRA